MKTITLRLSLIFSVLLGLAVGVPTLRAQEHKKLDMPDIYDESLDGNKQVADAIVTAQKEHKRILLQFGANWCIWCHRLHKTLETDKSVNDELKAGYILVLVDVNKGHNKDLYPKYKAEHMGGIPFLVVLDSDGKHLVTKDSGELEEGNHHDPKKVLDFLKQWAPKQ